MSRSIIGVKVLTVILGALIVVSGLYCVFFPGLTYLSIGVNIQS